MEKKKITLCAMGHEGRFTFILVQKDKEFFSWLANLLYRAFKIPDVDTYNCQDLTGEWVSRKKQIRNFTDTHESYYLIAGKERVDVFYGKNKVFITINAPFEEKRKFLDLLKDSTQWNKTGKASFHLRLRSKRKQK